MTTFHVQIFMIIWAEMKHKDTLNKLIIECYGKANNVSILQNYINYLVNISLEEQLSLVWEIY